jgi:GNAT superfamily N-acetyltransferase
MKNYSIRFGKPDDISQLSNFMFSQYRKDKSTGYFQWQFFESAYPTSLVVAESNNHIVGMLGLQKRMLVNGLIVGQAIDMLVSPEFRGKGVFAGMINYAVEQIDDIDILFVLPNLNGKIAVEKLGWKTVGKIDDLILSSFQDKPISDQSLSQHLLRFEYTYDTLKWRFANHPENHYKYFQEYDDIAFLKLFHDNVNNIKFGDIVYWEMVNPRFLKSIISYFVKQKAQAVSCWALPGTNRYKTLKSIGFQPSPRERYLCYRNIREISFDLNLFLDWDLHQADAEFY